MIAKPDIPKINVDYKEVNPHRHYINTQGDHFKDQLVIPNNIDASNEIIKKLADFMK